MTNPCVHCYYARMRTDICGIYCTGGFEKQDGTCEHFKEYKPKADHMALVAQSGALTAAKPSNPPQMI